MNLVLSQPNLCIPVLFCPSLGTSACPCPSYQRWYK